MIDLPSKDDLYYQIGSRSVPMLTSDNNCTTPTKKTIRGLFTIQSAWTILQLAYVHDDLMTQDNKHLKEALDDFMERVERVMKDLPTRRQQPQQPSLCLVVVEGLDGSGKSTLVKSLARHYHVDGVHQEQAAPPASVTTVRPVFDGRGGPIARAFYMISNYLLQQEIYKSIKNAHEPMIHHKSQQPVVIIIDRWYSSTCAYSVAWKNTEGGVESIRSLPSSLFGWPADLIQPNLLLLLHVDHATRRQRMAIREGEEATQPTAWDERLAKDPQLGNRIWKCWERLRFDDDSSVIEDSCERMDRRIVVVDASQSKDQVLQEAIQAIDQNLNEKSRLSATVDIPASPPSHRTKKRPLTLVLTGCHCSGKTTIARRLVQALQSRQDDATTKVVHHHAELGDVLRKKDALVPNGHLHGDGTSKTVASALCWDDRVFQAEYERDEEWQTTVNTSSSTDKEGFCRVVETWHIGNLAWAWMRHDAQRQTKNPSPSVSPNHDKIWNDMVQRAHEAMLKEIQDRDSRVILVHLQISPTTMTRRRQNDVNQARLPLDDEEAGGAIIYQALEEKSVELWDAFLEPSMAGISNKNSVATLRLSNDQDGDSHIEDSVRSILAFVQEHDNILC